MDLIDLRSDTVTRPTEAMHEAMRHATLDDDGLDGDPTVRRLERLAASVLGQDDALFVVSGTMGNLVASLAHGSRGGEALVDEDAHIARSEAGGISRLAGLVCHRIPSVHGEMDLAQVCALLRSGHTRQGQPTAMVVVESSHNHAGGAVPSLTYLRELRRLAQGAGAAVHLDGARLFNAAAALDMEAGALAACADSVTICLSKGLSAPMGSMLAGSTSFIQRARTYRRMVGGGLRQAGIMAAAGIVALEQMTQRLKDDNDKASIVWQQLKAAAPALVLAAAPETNIVLVDLKGALTPRPVDQWLALLSKHGVSARARDACTLRLVTHRHISAADAREAARRVLEVLLAGDNTDGDKPGDPVAARG